MGEDSLSSGQCVWEGWVCVALEREEKKKMGARRCWTTSHIIVNKMEKIIWESLFQQIFNMAGWKRKYQRQIGPTSSLSWYFIYGTCPVGRHPHVPETLVCLLCSKYKAVSYDFQIERLTDYFSYVLCLSSEKSGPDREAIFVNTPGLL